MVISSPWKTALLSRLRMSVDYYHIKVRNAIALQNDLTSCSSSASIRPSTRTMT